MKKNIIGFIGEHDMRISSFCEKLEKNKFKKFKIIDKVKEVSKFLIKGEISSEVLHQVRLRGYQVNKLYWVNLLLSSINEEDTNIIIEDLNEFDIVDEIMKIYNSSEKYHIQGCTNIKPWDEERLSKEISRIIKMSKK